MFSDHLIVFCYNLQDHWNIYYICYIKALGFKKCLSETDANILADECHGAYGRSYFHTIVTNCVEYFKRVDNVLVEFVHRSANGVLTC